MQYEFNGNDANVSLNGELTFTDHVAFREVASRLLKATDQSLTIDLSKLDFIDSAGLGMLLIVRDEANKANRSLTLRGPKGQVERMFSVTKFNTLFTVVA
ncbi:MAG TPA: STAS domain-containing protein [Rhodopseudomonas sp.]|uniref:STAS domain-containing protein n=1 Tax=Rhodopseudomonas sp. TaxID=1078 RepID=UPI002ED8EA89